LPLAIDIVKSGGKTNELYLLSNAVILAEQEPVEDHRDVQAVTLEFQKIVIAS
jgi:hypothetical protein